MKKLRGFGIGRIRDENGKFECDEIVLDLDHGRSLSIRRESVGGEDGLSLLAGIERADRLSNARFVNRAYKLWASASEHRAGQMNCRRDLVYPVLRAR